MPKIEVKLKNTEPYIYDICIIKQYGDKYRLMHFNALKQKGLENAFTYTPKGSKNENKTDQNISRAKSRVFELAMCNDWEWFITITLDPAKYDRQDLNKFRKDFNRFILNHYRKYGYDVKYLLIPEEHSKGGWHMHGFIMGLPEDAMREFTLQEKLPIYILNKLKDGNTVCEWTKYRKKFGFNDCEPILNKQACSAYVTKYITKDLSRTVKESGAHLYYCSQGLNRAKEIKRGRISQDVQWDFENEYYSTKWLPDGCDISSLFMDNDSIKDKEFQDTPFLPNCDFYTGEIGETPWDE